MSKEMTIAQIRLWIKEEIEADKGYMEKHEAEGNMRLKMYYEVRIDGLENVLSRTGGI